MVYILGDRPFDPPQIGLLDGFTAVNGGWNNQDVYPRQLADVNGDNRADIVGFGLDNVFVSLARGNGTFSTAQVGFSDGLTVNNGGWSSQDIYPRQLADVNGDGLADIVAFGLDNVFVSLAKGDGTFNPAQVGLSDGFTVNDGGWINQHTTLRQLADVNGDGLADIVGFGLDNVFVSLARGDGTFEQGQVGLSDGFTVNDGGWSSDIDFQVQYPRLLADVNGDGRADIVGFGLNDVYVSLAKEDGTFQSAQVGLADGFTVNDGWANQNRYPRQLADVNEDGRIDIVGFGQDRIYVSLGNGNGTFAPAEVGLYNDFTVEGGWATQTEYPRQLADVNNDGFADIVGFARDYVYVSLGTGNRNDFLVGSQDNDTIDGLTGNDRLWGVEGNDFLLGGSGNDILTGGAGNDRMTGGTGSDRFQFNAGTRFSLRRNGSDRITDFTPSLDKILLDKNTFRSLASSLGNGFSVASEFAIVNRPAAAAAQSAKIVYVNTIGALIYNQNGSASGFGSGGRFAVLNGNPVLTANDFRITPFSSDIFG